jgi:hypothetical protein
VRDREGSKHSTAATLERVYSEAAVLPQDFEDTVHARQLKALCLRRCAEECGAKDESSRSGTLTFNITHASERGVSARKSRVGSRIAGVRKIVGSRFTPACNTSALLLCARVEQRQMGERAAPGVREREDTAHAAKGPLRESRFAVLLLV